MATHLSKRITTYNNGSYQLEHFTEPPAPTIQYWMQKEDIPSGVFNGGLRPCATEGGCPAVFILLTPTLKVVLDKNWQYYIIGINNRMSLEDVSSVLDGRLAFCNGTGWRSEPLRNYILNKDLTALDDRGRPAYPKFDKDRTCSRSVMTGINLGSVLRLQTMNGNLPPPLKAGKTYPQRIEDINIDDYLYNPRDHRHLFFAANVVASKPGNQSSVAPFPRGAIYDWTGDNLPYTWLPHVSRHSIDYSLSQLVKVPIGSPLPSPYRIVR